MYSASGRQRSGDKSAASTTDACWVHTDRYGVITAISDEAVALLDLDVRENLGRPLAMLFADDPSGIDDDMRTAFDDAALIIRERTLTLSDGQRIPVRVSVEVLEETRELKWVLWRHCVDFHRSGARRTANSMRMKRLDGRRITR